MTRSPHASHIPGRRGLSRLRNLGSTTPGLPGQGLRFALTGCIVALIYLTTTTVLADIIGMPFQVALAIGFCVGLATHFMLQRMFVWAHAEEFALPVRRQARRYLTAAAIQYGVTSASTSLLPFALDVPTEIVYVVTAVVVASVNFLVFRHGIFHAKPKVVEPVSDSLSPYIEIGTEPPRSNPQRT